MKRFRLIVFACWIGNLAAAHFPVFHPAGAIVETEKPVSFAFWVGHPYEGDCDDADKPQMVFAVDPRGNETDLSGDLVAGETNCLGETKTSWSLAFTPDQKGNYIVALNSAPSISRNGENLYQEYLKTVLHVERGGSWEQRSGQPLEIVPMTRPYGLLEGFTFTGRLLKGEEPVANQTVYIEHLEVPSPKPDEIPPEPFVTYEVNTDHQGYFSTTLPESGWWILASYVDDIGKIEHDGKTYNHNAMAGIWVHVE